MSAAPAPARVREVRRRLRAHADGIARAAGPDPGELCALTEPWRGRLVRSVPASRTTAEPDAALDRRSAGAGRRPADHRPRPCAS